MRFSIILLLLLGFPILLAAQPFSHEVHAAVNDDPSLQSASGTVWVQAIGYGSNDVKAQRDAEKAALEALLFQGLPGTQYTTALVANETTSRKEHGDFYVGFIDDEGYRKFVTNTVKVQGLSKMKKGGKKLETRILFDVNGLRKYLEENNVIRKFGL